MRNLLTTLRQLGGLGAFAASQRRGESEDPWLCGTGFSRLCRFGVTTLSICYRSPDNRSAGGTPTTRCDGAARRRRAMRLTVDAIVGWQSSTIQAAVRAFHIPCMRRNPPTMINAFVDDVVQRQYSRHLTGSNGPPSERTPPPLRAQECYPRSSRASRDWSGSTEPQVDSEVPPDLLDDHGLRGNENGLPWV